MSGIRIITLTILKYMEGVRILSESPKVLIANSEDVSLINTMEPKMRPICCIRVWRKLTSSGFLSSLMLRASVEMS